VSGWENVGRNSNCDRSSQILWWTDILSKYSRTEILTGEQSVGKIPADFLMEWSVTKYLCDRIMTEKFWSEKNFD